ncbi:MAG: hypothetical protein AMS14_02320 [Planctomycetes bacterium DG_20]|nr:MAG: hypothetical protein AMS14_02320 [Planctomycetes bacterium DG_20]
MRRHDYDKEAELRARVVGEPARSRVHTELAAWLNRAGRSWQAREVLQTGLGVAQQTARLHHLLGLILCGGGDLDSGLRHLERAVEKEPTRFAFLRDLALAQGAAGRTAASVESLHQAMRLGGEEAVRLKWLLRVGERALADRNVRPDRRPPQASRRAAVIERIVSRNPEVAEALIPRKGAPGSNERETLQAARRALVRLAAQNPSHADLHFGLSLVEEQLGEIDRAVEAAEKALTLNPHYVEACLLAVRLYEKSGKAGRAEQRCRHATRLKPRWADVHARLGHILHGQGRGREAAEAYQHALEIDADCHEARQGVATLDAAPAGEGGGE